MAYTHIPDDKLIEKQPSEETAAIVLAVPSGELDVEYSKEEPGAREARRLCDLVAAGDTPGKAAHKMHTSLEALSKFAAVRKTLQDLYTAHKLPAEVRREMVRAGMNKVFLENIERLDEKSAKLAIEAAKVIGADPEVGLNQAPQAVGINISFTDIQKVLDKAVENPIAGITGLEGDEREKIIEAEFEDKAPAAE